MNQRIKQLAKQTGYIWHASGDPQIYEFTPEKLEKFAELIVEEMYVFMCNATDNDKPWPSFKEVKEHFGVEE